MFQPLGEYIRLRRLARHLTQERLAKLAGVSRRQLSLLEDGRNVSVLFLIKICNVLEIDELPLGKLRLIGTAAEIDTIVRAAEAIERVKPTIPVWEKMVADLREASTILDGLLARALTRGLPNDELIASAQVLASLPPGHQDAGDTLRELATRDPDARAPRPDDSDAANKQKG